MQCLEPVRAAKAELANPPPALAPGPHVNSQGIDAAPFRFPYRQNLEFIKAILKTIA
jgi:hypothetical protein